MSLLHETAPVDIEDRTGRIESGRFAVEDMEVSSQAEATKTRLGELLASARSVLDALGVREAVGGPGARGGAAGGARGGVAGAAGALGGGVSAVVPQEAVRTAAGLGAAAGLIIEEARAEVSPVVESLSALGVEVALLRRYEPMLRKIRPLASQIATTVRGRLGGASRGAPVPDGAGRNSRGRSRAHWRTV